MIAKIELIRKKTGEVYTFFSSCGPGPYVILKDREGRQHHFRIDELVRDFDCSKEEK